MSMDLHIFRAFAVVCLGAVIYFIAMTRFAGANPDTWRYEWPDTDFSRASVELSEIISGGPPKDGIPAIDKPQFVSIENCIRVPAQAGTQNDVDTRLLPSQEHDKEECVYNVKEPVISLNIKGDARAYPLGVLTWHEIANDTVGGVPVIVTYCPLCNAAIVFKRVVNGKPTEFGVTGKLRKSDMVMYDRQTESWWQQFGGDAIVGEMTGTVLEKIPARLESFERFAARHPAGKVLVPNNPRARNYGSNPYVGYDTMPAPFLYRGDMPDGVPPMAYVVAVDDEAWTLNLLRDRGGLIESGDLRISWEAGMASALDAEEISTGRDVGNIVVERKKGDGYTLIPYDLTFAFVFHAFRPDGILHR